MEIQNKCGPFIISSKSANVDSKMEVNIENFSEVTNDNDTNKIETSLNLKPLVRTLQYFGGYSVQINTAQNANNKRMQSCEIQKSEHVYETTIFKWTDPRAWYSYILHAIKIFPVLTYLCNIGLGIPYPVKLFSVGPELEKAFGFTGSSYDGIEFAGAAILNIVKTMLVFWNTEEFVRWLNNWSYFERDFLSCFKACSARANKITPLSMKVDIFQFSNRVLVFYLALPSVLWIVVVCKYMLPLFIYHVKFVSIACLFVGSIATSVHPLMEDAKVLIILKTNVSAFEQILAGIKNSGKSRSLTISANDVIGWRGLLKRVREQTALASQYLKSQEMMSVAETILSCSLGVSYVLRLVTKNSLNSMTTSIIMTALGNCYYSLTNFLRLYLKSLLAENISAVERLVAEEVLQIDSITRDVATKTELKFLYSQITQNTVSVNFGNYFLLNKKLLLNVGAQVVTYLIVIMQFQSSK